ASRLYALKVSPFPCLAQIEIHEATIRAFGVRFAYARFLDSVSLAATGEAWRGFRHEIPARALEREIQRLHWRQAPPKISHPAIETMRDFIGHGPIIATEAAPHGFGVEFIHPRIKRDQFAGFSFRLH